MSKYTPSLKDQLASAGSVPTMLVPETGKIPITTKLTVDNSSGPAEIEAPKTVEYLKEPVHTLKFTDTAGFGSSRIAVLDDAATANGYIKGWLDSTAKGQFESYSGGMYEQYHPDVFPKELAAEMTLDKNTNVYPDGTPLKSSFIRKRDGSAVQYGMDKNIETHNKRIKTAAKAALMLYRCTSTGDFVTEEYKAKYKSEHPNAIDSEIKESFVNETNEELDKNTQSMNEKIREVEEEISALQTAENANPKGYHSDRYLLNLDNKRTKYKDISGDYQNARSISQNLDNATLEAIANMKTSKMDLPDSLNSYQLKSNYGMWGKYYTGATGFHRGIDITFGSGSPIYSICTGTVIRKLEYTMLIVEVKKPISFSGKYLTYMHANFSVDKGDLLSLGQQIGTESDHSAGGKFHTHIELNATDPPDPGSFVQAKWERGAREPLYSTAPYEFIEACFQDFWDAVGFANDTYQKISKS